MTIIDVLDLKGFLGGRVADTFSEMVAMQLKANEAILDDYPLGEKLAASIELHGRVEGELRVVVSAEFGLRIGCAMLSQDPGMLDDAMVRDVVGEVTNMIVGNLETDFGNVGLECNISVPLVEQFNDIPFIQEGEQDGVRFERVFFGKGRQYLVVELKVASEEEPGIF